MASYKTCFEVSLKCPVEATTYGYYPALGPNLALCVLFGITGLLQIGLGAYYRTWTWAAIVSFGCLLEFAGYVGRVFMHQNPWNNSAFEDQIITLIVAPSFLAAGINLTLKHLVIAFEPGLSRIKPAGYTWIFISIDFGCIALQAIGGGMAASADSTNNTSVLNAGNHVIVAGICLQVLNLLVFGFIGAEYALRLYRSRETLGQKLEYAKDRKLQFFLAAVILSYLTILIRSIYRIPEMAYGWGSKNQRNETDFLILDGLMVVVAAIALTAVHPGWSFPQLARSKASPPKNLEDGEVAELDTA